jgi:hypothetical protein
MIIACLGWGSLTWDPRDLPVQRYWFNDGPLLPLEFARRSSGNRVTLVLVPGATCVRSLWTLMTVADLDSARQALAKREGISALNTANGIGWWTPSREAFDDPVSSGIGRWASQVGLDAAVWTALAPGLDRHAKAPTPEEVISFLQGLPADQKQGAEEYVRKTPRQIDTETRRRIEAEFGWTPIDPVTARWSK